MIYLAAGLYCGALVTWVAVNEALRYRRRRRVLARLETAVPHPSDPEPRSGRKPSVRPYRVDMRR